jgi:hypothetical protein
MKTIELTNQEAWVLATTHGIAGRVFFEGCSDEVEEDAAELLKGLTDVCASIQNKLNKALDVTRANVPLKNELRERILNAASAT